MEDLIFPDPRNNPKYRFFDVMSDYNYNFSAITSTINSFTGGTNYFTTLSADTIYLSGTSLENKFISVLDILIGGTW